MDKKKSSLSVNPGFYNVSLAYPLSLQSFTLRSRTESRASGLAEVNSDGLLRDSVYSENQKYATPHTLGAYGIWIVGPVQNFERLEER